MKGTVETVKLTVTRGRIESMSTLTITGFLEARIAEDEARAQDFEYDLARSMNGDYSNYDYVHGAKASWNTVKRIGFTPARVLAECAAKRAIIRSYNSCVEAERNAGDFGPRLVTSGMVKGLEISLKIIAGPYAGHEDYREEWSKS